MKTKISILIRLSVLLSSLYCAHAQEGGVRAANNAHEIIIPKLSVLIDSAITNNGMVNYRVLEVTAKESNLKSKKKYWTRNFGIQADSRYGTFDNFSSNVSGPSTTTLYSTTTQFNFGAGLYLKIPLFDIINRKSDIRQAKAELAQAESLVKFQQEELAEQVIRYYEDLILRQKLLAVRAENLGNARVNMEMVEKEFRNGLIPIYEYVRISDMTSRITSEYEEAKSEFLVSKELLENLAGVKLN